MRCLDPSPLESTSDKNSASFKFKKTSGGVIPPDLLRADSRSFTGSINPHNKPGWRSVILRVRCRRRPTAALCRHWWSDCWGRRPASPHSAAPNTGFECGNEWRASTPPDTSHSTNRCRLPNIQNKTISHLRRPGWLTEMEYTKPNSTYLFRSSVLLTLKCKSWGQQGRWPLQVLG